MIAPARRHVLTFRDTGRVCVAPPRDRETLGGCGETPFGPPECPYTQVKQGFFER
jgi:hypothetical protein